MAYGRRNLNLADLAEWPKTTIGDEDVIRNAYEEALTAAARVHQFATGKEPHSEGPLVDRQESLAIKDIETFAYQARRLVENTLGAKRASKVLLLAIVDAKTKEFTPITRVINALVHHQSIYFAGHMTRYRLFDRSGAPLDQMEIQKGFHPRLCVVMSDKGKKYGFVIENLIETFQEKLLEKIIDLCSEQGLWLEDDC